MSPPIVLLHGFSGHGDSWRAVRAALPDHRIETFTAFGHGAPVSRAIRFEDEVERIVDFLRTFGEPVRLCGYSMGGRLTLGVLASAPDLVDSAALIGAHPGLTSDEERTARAASDDVWVRMLQDSGMAVFADKWQAQPLFATQARLDAEVLASQHAIRMRHDPRSLALAMTSLGLATMPSYWEVLEGTRVPIDVVVGALDGKFQALAARMQTRIPHELGRLITVDAVGHNVPLESPLAVARAIASRPSR